MNEPDNQNRVINFTNDMTHDMALYLKAACILNGREMSGAIPEFTPEDMKLLGTSIGKTQYTALLEAINQQPKNLPKKENQPQEKPAEEKHVEEKTAEEKVTEKKVNDAEIIIKSPEDLNKVLNDAQNARKELKDSYEKGFITIKLNPETKEQEIVAGPKLNDQPQKDKILEEAKANGDLLRAIAKAHDKYNKAKLDKIRSGIDTHKLDDYDKAHGTRAAQIAAKDKEMAIKLGIAAAEGANKPLSGDELAKYVSDNKIDKFTYMRLWNKENNPNNPRITNEKLFEQQLKPEQAKVYKSLNNAVFNRTASHER